MVSHLKADSAKTAAEQNPFATGLERTMPAPHAAGYGSYGFKGTAPARPRVFNPEDSDEVLSNDGEGQERDQSGNYSDEFPRLVNKNCADEMNKADRAAAAAGQQSNPKTILDFFPIEDTSKSPGEDPEHDRALAEYKRTGIYIYYGEQFNKDYVAASNRSKNSYRAGVLRKRKADGSLSGTGVSSRESSSERAPSAKTSRPAQMNSPRGSTP